MRKLARRRAALDAEEAHVLIAAKRAEIHKHLGYGSFGEYLERVCGYAPSTARDRIRVAEALHSLPAMRDALAAGDVTFSAVRELTRVVTPETEEAWLAAVDRCTVREIEDCVRGHAPGDLPDDRPDPDLETRVLRMELPPNVYALFLEARRRLEHVVGQSMNDAEFMAHVCRGVLGGGGGGGEGERDDNEPPHQIAVTVCADCKRGWQETGSRSVELAPPDIERMRCDAVELGRVDGDVVGERVRTIPAPVRRAVLARDHRRCTIPGCTSSVFVDLHHLTPWNVGGDHSMQNLTTLCCLHHDLAHHGRIVITGTPGSMNVTHADGRPYGAPPVETLELPGATHVGRADPPPPELIRDARGALRRLGFGTAAAHGAVDRAATHVGCDASLEQLIRAALREFWKPTA